MNAADFDGSADPQLVRDWLAGRSIARGLPAPIAEHGGWRVETASPGETRRFVFARAGEGLAALAASITDPLIALKLFASETAMRAIMPGRWTLQPGNYLMTSDAPPPPEQRLPPGYRFDLHRDGAVAAVRIVTLDGALAASGYAAEAHGVFVYDRIVTADPHQRRGLGRAVMAALGAARRSGNSRQVLVATRPGRALYETLGWTVQAPYTTAVIPG